MASTLSYRYNVTNPENILVLPEMWSIIFSFITVSQYQNLLYVSNWFNNLFWDYCSEYNFSKIKSTRDILTILEKCNPNRVIRIDLSNTCFHPRLVEQIKNFTNLKILNLDDTELTDLSIEQLFSLTKLTKLNLTKCRITTKLLENICQFTNLEELIVSRTLSSALRLKGTMICDDGFANIGNLQNLTSLTIGEYLELSSKGLKLLVGLPKLRILKLSSRASNHDTGLDKMSQLVELHLYDVLFDVHKKIHEISTLPLLEVLNLSGSDIEDADLMKLAVLPKLRELDISYCSQITYGGIKNFLNLALDSNLEIVKLMPDTRAKYENEKNVKIIKIDLGEGKTWKVIYDQ